MSHTPGAICHEALLSTAKANESKSYRDVVTAGSDLANPNNPEGVQMTSAKNLVHQAGFCDDGLPTVKKTRNEPGNTPELSNPRIHKSRPALRSQELLQPPCDIFETYVKITFHIAPPSSCLGFRY